MCSGARICSRVTEPVAAGTAAVELTPLELASGQPYGRIAPTEVLPEIAPELTPLAAFEEPIRRALERPPCLVTFSGGRDSSAALAVARRIALEEGLPLPVPITVRFSDAPGAREDEWQELVISRLGLADWIKLDVGEELDYVGPLAQRLLLRHGVLSPPVVLLFATLLEHARGGSLLTGMSGDAVCGGWLRPHWAELMAGRARPQRGDVPFLGYALTPRPVRHLLARRYVVRPSWLTPAAWHAYREANAGEIATRPARWDRYLLWYRNRRRLHATRASIARVATAADAFACHPFQELRFLAALARAGGARGLGDRAAVMRFLFAGELPDELLVRSTKGNFTLAYLRTPTRAFARRWDGRGLDRELVDAERLREAWLRPVVDPRAALLLQAAWVDSVQRGVEQPLAHAV